MTKNNKSRGFIKTIIIIVIAIFIMSYYNITIGDAFSWFVNLIKNVFKM